MELSKSCDNIHRTVYADNFLYLPIKGLVVYFRFEDNKKVCMQKDVNTGGERKLFSGSKYLCDLIASEDEEYLAFSDGAELFVFSFLTGELKRMGKAMFPAQFIKEGEYLLCVHYEKGISSIVICDINLEFYRVVKKLEGYIGDPLGSKIYKGYSTKYNLTYFEEQGALAVIINSLEYNESHLILYSLTVGDYSAELGEKLFCKSIVEPLLVIPMLICYSKELLVYKTYSDNEYQLVSLHVVTQREEIVKKEKRHIKSLARGEDGVLCEVVDPRKSSSSIVSFSLENKESKILVEEEGVNQPIAEEKSCLYFVHSSHHQPPELWEKPINVQQSRQLTWSIVYNIEKRITAGNMTVECLPSGVNVKIYRADSCLEKRPAIVWLHGGPNIYSLNDFVPFEKWLSRLGYVVCVPSYRGTIGYSVNQAKEAVAKGIGVNDVQDVLDTIQYCRNLEYVDGDKVVVAGVSYGGYLAMCGSMQ